MVRKESNQTKRKFAAAGIFKWIFGWQFKAYNDELIWS